MNRYRLMYMSGVVLLAAGCGEQSNAPREDMATLPDGEYIEFTVKDPQQSAAFMAVEDLNNDGVKEIVLSTLLEVTPPGPPGALSRGALRVFSTQQGLDGPWDEQVVVEPSLLDGYPFINTPQVMDINEDGVKDILVQTGFLSTFGGTQFWLEGPEFTQRHYFSDETRWSASNFFWHESAQLDLDGDGLLDIVTTSAQTQDLLSNPMGSPDGNELLKVEWYRQLENGEFEYHKLLDDVGGVFLKMHDVDADGDQDILLTHFFGYPQQTAIQRPTGRKPAPRTARLRKRCHHHEIEQCFEQGRTWMIGSDRHIVIVPAYDQEQAQRQRQAQQNHCVLAWNL